MKSRSLGPADLGMTRLRRGFGGQAAQNKRAGAALKRERYTKRKRKASGPPTKLFEPACRRRVGTTRATKGKMPR